MLPTADATQMEAQPGNRSSTILTTAVKPVQIGGQDFCQTFLGPWAEGKAWNMGQLR